MYEPAPGLIAAFRSLHRVMIYSLTVNIDSLRNSVDLSVKFPRRHEAPHGKISGSNAVSVGNSISGQHITEAIICNALTFAFEKLRIIIQQNEIVEAIIFPVI